MRTVESILLVFFILLLWAAVFYNIAASDPKPWQVIYGLAVGVIGTLLDIAVYIDNG